MWRCALWFSIAGMMSVGMNLAVPHSFSETSQAPLQDIVKQAKSAILIDADTGTVLVEKNKDEQLPPASITKIMTMLLVMEAIEQGKLSLTELVRTSEYAASMGGSQIFLQVGEEMKVEDMLKGIALASGNDASVAMAEHIAGSEALFVELMNQRAAQLGMTHTRFANCNGLPQDNHYSTAHDIARMSQALLKHDKITSFTGIYQDYLRKDSVKPFWLVNTNKLVRFYPGADGLKTGFTQAAKFCLSATAKRDQLRVIAVVMGEPDTKTRQAEVTHLFDFAFAQFQSVSVIRKGEKFGDWYIPNGETAHIPMIAQTDYTILLKKGENPTAVRYDIVWNAIHQAPLSAGQAIGKLRIFQQDQLQREIILYSPTDVAQAGWWTRTKRFLSKMLFLSS